MPNAMKTTLAALSISLACQACSLSSHQIAEPRLGTPTSAEAMERTLDAPGTVDVETVASCDWEVPLSGLLNLDRPEARAAKLADRPEPIQVFVHVLRHPKFGTYLVDTGVARALVADPAAAGLAWPVRLYFPLDRMRLRQSTDDLLARLPGGVRGIFFTHLHLDHISGMPAVPPDVPLYVGRGEAGHRSFQNLFLRTTTDQLLAGKADFHEWPFRTDPATGKPLAGDVVDIFGDGSAYALSVPGHTDGSTAYVVRTPKGPVLLTGDVSHTRWGWEHGVEPGSYTEDHAANRASLQRLKELAARHPSMEVRLGHQY